MRATAESTKLRIVYDASARALCGTPSLNDCLHTGPPLQNKLWSVLVRGHFNPLAITGDIQKAFLQVRVKETDRDAMRFHWGRDEQSPLETLRFTRALFGLAPSPFLLGGVVEMHLNHWEEKEPELVVKIRKELYVDDLISGSTTVSKTRELKDKTTTIVQDACFKLHKWHSNVPELESEQPPKEEGEPTYAKQQLGVPQGTFSSMLGLPWNKEPTAKPGRTIRMPGLNTRRVSSLHTRYQHAWPPTSRGSTPRNIARGSGTNHGQGAYPLLDSKIETACEESAQELSWVQEVSSNGLRNSAAWKPADYSDSRNQPVSSDWGRLRWSNPISSV